MPKAKKYSIRRRSKGKHYSKTKRGGLGTHDTDELDAMETGQKYGDNYVMPNMMNPMDIQESTTNQQLYQDIPAASPEEVSQFFEDRSNKLEEIDTLTKKYEQVRKREQEEEKKKQETIQKEIQRLKDVKKMEELNRNPLTKEEVIKVFDNPPADCTGPGCIVSGGRKSRRYRRKGRKSRRHRKSRKH